MTDRKPYGAAAADGGPLVDVEREVLGWLLVKPDALAEVRSILRPDDFKHPGHGGVYEAACDAQDAERPVDVVTVADRMRAAGTLSRLNQLGGEDYLLGLQGGVTSSAALVHHARGIAAAGRRRRWVRALDQLAAKARDQSLEHDYALTELEHDVAALQEDRPISSELRPIGLVVRSWHKQLQERSKAFQEGRVVGVRTHLRDVDAMLAGLQPTWHYTIGARPGHGKTAIAMNIVCNTAMHDGTPALVFSFEMVAERLVQRMASRLAKVDSKRYTRGSLDRDQWVQTSAAQSALVKLPIWFEDRPNITIWEVCAKARRWRNDPRIFPTDQPDKLGVVVIDYLQLVNPEHGDERSREREVATISRALKNLAGEIRLPVVSLVQLNRGLEEREEKRPRVSDIRESGSIEQDSDVIAFMFREEKYKPNIEALRGKAEMIFGKNRDGEEGTVELKWVKQFTAFEDGPEQPRQEEIDAAL